MNENDYVLNIHEQQSQSGGVTVREVKSLSQNLITQQLNGQVS
jgi:hypothetical protein